MHYESGQEHAELNAQSLVQRAADGGIKSHGGDKEETTAHGEAKVCGRTNQPVSH